MTTSALVSAIGELLDAAGVGDYNATGPLAQGETPITVGAMPKSPGAAIVLTTYPGGPEPDTRNGWEFPRLQVRVRAQSPLDALDLDRAVFDVLQAKAVGQYPVQLDGWWLQDCHAIQSEAQPMGVDANGRHEFTRNYQLTCWPS
jgi:hypothetical protein